MKHDFTIELLNFLNSHSDFPNVNHLEEQETLKEISKYLNAVPGTLKIQSDSKIGVFQRSVGKDGIFKVALSGDTAIIEKIDLFEQNKEIHRFSDFSDEGCRLSVYDEQAFKAASVNESESLDMQTVSENLDSWGILPDGQCEVPIDELRNCSSLNQLTLRCMSEKSFSR